MVTLAGTQNFNEFELHLRAILSLPIFEITLEKQVLALIAASENSTNPTFTGLEKLPVSQNRFQNFWQTYFKTVSKNGGCISQ
jgi:formate-dependent phosphoribosylglycinamide formyltransferase (GAR transformylase)